MRELLRRFALLYGWTLLAVALWPADVRAVDGVIEINQARALAGGVTATDSTGFPVIVDASGSYRLTSNLNVPAGSSAIVLSSAAKDVTIDLNGYAIIGVRNPADPLLDGIVGSSNGSLRVSNGTIRDMNASGIFTNGVLIAERVESVNNGFSGLWGGDDTSLVDVTALNNGSHGIRVGDRTKVYRCSTNTNFDGILAGKSSVIVNSTAIDNTGNGIYADNGSVVTGNTANGNGGDGIAGASGLTVTDNSARTNTGFGIHITSGGYGGNVLTNNGAGSVSGGLQIGTNVCGTDITCP